MQELSRIWWCPTGPLALLPIHAAGLYDTDEPGSKLSDFVISSYTHRLSSLIDIPHCATTRDSFQLLAVAQTFAGTERELNRIQKHAGGLAVLPLTGSNATVERVVQGMKESSWVHFTCGGVHDHDNPTESGLHLADRSLLKLSEIIKLSLPHAGLAFLSACDTATGAMELPDEALHIAAAMLFAGYRGVIATMWSMNDSDGPRVADEVYARLFEKGIPDHTQAARALHYAVQKLRAEKASFLSWVPLIHIGV